MTGYAVEVLLPASPRSNGSSASPRMSGFANFVAPVADRQLSVELPEPDVIAGIVRSAVPERLSQRIVPEVIGISLLNGGTST